MPRKIAPKAPAVAECKSVSELLPAAEIDPSTEHNKSPQPSTLASAAEIERPKSALHSGDFWDRSAPPDAGQSGSSSIAARPHVDNQQPLDTSPTTPWYTLNAIPSQFHTANVYPEYPQTTNVRSRAPSLGSLSSSFVFQAPTSPLVQQSNTTDLDLIPRDIQGSPSKNSRRRTLPSESFRSFQTFQQTPSRTTNFSRPLPGLRRETTLPCQAHQPRRSLTTTFNMRSSSPPRTPAFPGSRRPSYSSDVSPLQHASMVGSYEESILRGRMSTTPSKPLNFVAQIGVLGKGNCKPNLRCPAHVTVPFPAVFYSYPTVSGTRSSVPQDSPSPYVGNIDLENSLKPEDSKSRRQGHSPDKISSPNPDRMDITAPENTHIGVQLERRKREKKRRRSQSPKTPLGGCYRIPQQGQLQIVIKNPNKTAVKLYLVPYDLEAMEPGTKTFIRQRSYSAGSILDGPLAVASDPAIDEPGRAGRSSNDIEKPVLRYLIHLRICCPSRGRFYLYDNIRIVFANRVPDGKEKLRNEIQVPEPRYSPYKPMRESSMGSAGARLAAEKAFRRRSSGYGLTFGGHDAVDGIGLIGPTTLAVNTPKPPLPTSSIPISLALQDRHVTPSQSGRFNDLSPNAEHTGASPEPASSTDYQLRSFHLPSSRLGSNGIDDYGKLSKGDAGYGGSAYSFTSTNSEGGGGLLAMRLRGLGVRKDD